MAAPKNYVGEIRKLQDFLDEISKSKLTELPGAHNRLWFRGHSKDNWELQPGVYRPDFQAKDEAERLRTEQHMSQDFRVQAAGLLSGRETDADLYFLQQHYKMPTRLLDWTNSPLPALFFAVTSDSDCDGELFMMDAYQLSPCQKAAPDFEGIATSQHPLFVEAMKTISWWRKSDSFSEYILPVRPNHFDHRISLQRSCFTFHVPKRHILTTTENDSLLSFLIPKDAKEHMQKELFLLGIDDFSIYGDLENLSKKIKTAYGR